MRPQVVLVVTLAVVGVLAALPLGEGTEWTEDASASASSWPCCDDCGVCNRKHPPECQCNDISVHGYHPECKKCVRYTLIGTTTADDGIQKPQGGGGPGPVRTYRCADVLTNFWKHRCMPKPAAAFLGEVF